MGKILYNLQDIFGNKILVIPAKTFVEEKWGHFVRICAQTSLILNQSIKPIGLISDSVELIPFDELLYPLKESDSIVCFVTDNFNLENFLLIYSYQKIK